jgi:hypothetical protein
MMNRQTLTICFEIHEGDYPGSLGKVALTEVVQASFEDNEWIVTGTTEGITTTGKAEYKHQAILNYLQGRLGLLGHS